jgi:uncharacterized membrane protein YfcA
VDTFLLLLVIFLGVFVQSLAGFGSALVAMALLPGLIGIRAASPLVALIAGTLELVLLLRYRDALNLQAVWRLGLAAAAGIPVGVLLLSRLNERWVLGALGLVSAGYALYGLLNIRLPELRRPGWAFAFGFLAGMLGGAYNTSGPPAILYGNSRRWGPAEFKSNLQGFFLLTDALVIGSHALGHNLTPVVLRAYVIALPALGLGILAGVSLDRFLKPQGFRKIVLVLLAVMGSRLLLSALGSGS